MLTIGLLLLGVMLVLLWANCSRSFGFWLADRVIRSRFPGVPQISPAELHAWLEDANRARPLLLDVRTRAEYEVSHLPGAEQVNPEATPEEVKARFGLNRALVVYCSMGYRSSALAARLRHAGFEAVYNLRGSIFAWANQGRILEAHGQPADRVHPYNAFGGAFLDRAVRGRLSEK
jgi:rhodanese-related sulfurtransferase